MEQGETGERGHDHPIHIFVRIRNTTLCFTTRIINVSHKAASLKWNWAGHVCRMSDERFRDFGTVASAMITDELSETHRNRKTCERDYVLTIGYAAPYRLLAAHDYESRCALKQVKHPQKVYIRANGAADCLAGYQGSDLKSRSWNGVVFSQYESDTLFCLAQAERSSMSLKVRVHRAASYASHAPQARNISLSCIETHITAYTDPHRTHRIISNVCMRCVLMTSYGLLSCVMMQPTIEHVCSLATY
uniref:SFRICE_019707 n=1 Tax=Spodoptera frugiperda TaxID=7108 RepID=A0A2H1V5G7_SPOFR